MTRAPLVLLLAVLLGTAAPARAQERSFDDKLFRLLEVMGSVQFLRQLCDATETTRWRERAAALIEAEADGERRRARLTAAFNRGYKAFDAYADCTDNALFAIDRFMNEGERLSRDILLRYGS